jgi:hypothetical protein
MFFQKILPAYLPFHSKRAIFITRATVKLEFQGHIEKFRIPTDSPYRTANAVAVTAALTIQVDKIFNWAYNSA